MIAGNQNWSTPDQRHRSRLPADPQLADEVRRFFTQQDVNSAAKVAVLGTVVADTLFGEDVDPTGQIIRIRNQPFKVVGVMASKGPARSATIRTTRSSRPYTTVQKKLQGIQHIKNITVSRPTATPLPWPPRSAQTLRLRHKLMPGDPDDFMVRTLEEMASVRTETTKTMTTLLATIAGVSLLVGGIGIMNIMLVSVTERTREIGLRLAIGARGKDVLLQFLVEAIVFSLLGGLLGIGMGFALSAAERFLSWPTSIPAEALAWHLDSPR